MIKDIADSLKSSIKERTTNPFLGTFLIVAIFRNHRVVFALFNFDEKMTLEQKLNFIQAHYPKGSFIPNFFTTVGISVLILIITYCLLLFTRWLTNIYDIVAVPYITKWSKGDIVQRKDYDNLFQSVFSLKEDLKIKDEHRFKLEGERDDLLKRLSSLEHLVNNNAKPKTITTENDKTNSIILKQLYGKYKYSEDELKSTLEDFIVGLKPQPNTILPSVAVTLVNMGCADRNSSGIYHINSKGRSLYDFINS